MRYVRDQCEPPRKWKIYYVKKETNKILFALFCKNSNIGTESKRKRYGNNQATVSLYTYFPRNDASQILRFGREILPVLHLLFICSPFFFLLLLHRTYFKHKWISCVQSINFFRNPSNSCEKDKLCIFIILFDLSWEFLRFTFRYIELHLAAHCMCPLQGF